jgi:hypothetical protein
VFRFLQRKLAELDERASAILAAADEPAPDVTPPSVTVHIQKEQP